MPKSGFLTFVDPNPSAHRLPHRKPKLWEHSDFFLSLILHIQLSPILSVLPSKCIRTWSCHTISKTPLRVKPLSSAWIIVIKINLLTTVCCHCCVSQFILFMGARMMLEVNWSKSLLLSSTPFLTFYLIYTLYLTNYNMCVFLYMKLKVSDMRCRQVAVVLAWTWTSLAIDTHNAITLVES